MAPAVVPASGQGRPTSCSTCLVYLSLPSVSTEISVPTQDTWQRQETFKAVILKGGVLLGIACKPSDVDRTHTHTVLSIQ